MRVNNCTLIVISLLSLQLIPAPASQAQQLGAKVVVHQFLMNDVLAAPPTNPQFRAIRINLGSFEDTAGNVTALHNAGFFVICLIDGRFQPTYPSTQAAINDVNGIKSRGYDAVDYSENINFGGKLGSSVGQLSMPLWSAAYDAAKSGSNPIQIGITEPNSAYVNTALQTIENATSPDKIPDFVVLEWYLGAGVSWNRDQNAGGPWQTFNSFVSAMRSKGISPGMYVGNYTTFANMNDERSYVKRLADTFYQCDYVFVLGSPDSEDLGSEPEGPLWFTNVGTNPVLPSLQSQVEALTGPRFSITDATGREVAAISRAGHMGILGKKGSVTPGAKSFQLKSSTGSVLAEIDATGMLSTSLQVFPSQTSFNPVEPAFIINDATGNTLAVFDSTGIYLKRRFFQRNP